MKLSRTAWLILGRLRGRWSMTNVKDLTIDELEI